jgi:glycosyltransferase involved in cell wall biosynthesis
MGRSSNYDTGGNAECAATPLMRASVIVPTFNRRDIVSRTLLTLCKQDFSPTGFEIIVVVDGSTDGTARALQALKPPCRFRVIEQENRGLAGARNTGLHAAEGEVVIFLDDDMLCDARLVSEHCAAHGSRERVVGFGSIFLSDDSPPSLAAECFKLEVGAYYLKHKQDAHAPWPESACVFGNSSVARSVLVDAGGFDERFRMREDAELGVRLFAAGIRASYVSGAVAHQFYRKTAADLIQDAEAFAVADVMFANKHPERLDGSLLGRIGNEPRWKHMARRVVAAYPEIADTLLAPVCWAAEWFFDVRPIRNMGVRALQMRRGLHWYHKVMEASRAVANSRL